ncbi:3367_t:CDS:2 [Gigaspora rosea]|nr:3367_t:CDS:2 [Gigaspora rosea]
MIRDFVVLELVSKQLGASKGDLACFVIDVLAPERRIDDL